MDAIALSPEALLGGRSTRTHAPAETRTLYAGHTDCAPRFVFRDYNNCSISIYTHTHYQYFLDDHGDDPLCHGESGCAAHLSKTTKAQAWMDPALGREAQPVVDHHIKKSTYFQIGKETS